MMSPARTASDGGRLLAVTAVPPWPMQDGYSLRAAHLLEELSTRWDVTLVSPAPRSRSPGAPGGLDWVTVEGVPATNVLPWREERRLLIDRLQPILEEGEFRAAILWNGVEFAAREISGFPPTVADRIDCEALQAWRGRKHREGLRQKLRSLRRGLDLALYERKVLRSLDGLVVTGADDARALRFLTGHRRIQVVPNGVDLPRLGKLPEEGDRPAVIFTGVLDYGPNVEAALFFGEEIWPEVRRRLPEARFVIAGRSPVPELEALADDPGIELRPDVPDLTAEIRRAWVAVAPMRTGSGIKNKVLEAWAAGRPVVMTEMATNGLGLDESRQALADLVCRDEDQFAGTVVRLLEEPDLREKVGREARALAAEKHSWSSAGRDLARFILATCGTDAVQSTPADDPFPPKSEGADRARTSS